MTSKPWYQSRAVVGNALAILVFALGYILDNAGVLQIDPHWTVILGGLLGMANLWLRLGTNTAVSHSRAATKLATAKLPTSTPSR